MKVGQMIFIICKMRQLEMQTSSSPIPRSHIDLLTYQRFLNQLQIDTVYANFGLFSMLSTIQFNQMNAM